MLLRGLRDPHRLSDFKGNAQIQESSDTLEEFAIIKIVKLKWVSGYFWIADSLSMYKKKKPDVQQGI